ncbi:M20/M25/M40 family metallo-hydrolase [Gracilimonas sediminicola]|uniref:M20/M25/M40 family metallo-hydrolase n=1 Tax=Gracilimonas sediminicola TaxID=2952158 RepID=A0A9X2RDY6_9BACT|nr:M20/M25/M40 family metallo-hydrolase [Gracilimonas sediminicola]MCP9290742.1 M20/M25/M40 family metallo-hydrolase [Gracilimonas sediminicola]
MKKSLLLLAALLVISLGCTTQQQQATLDTEQLIEDLRVISSDEMEGRRAGTEGNRKAREYLVQRFEEEGAQPFQNSFTHEFTFTNRSGEEMTGVNVIGQIKGKTDSVMVITAHYDHLGIRDSLIYNGADDDASGTAALLAYIDYFSQTQPNHTLVFAAFDAEEMGLQGARAFVEDSVFLEKVKLNINLDMIAQNDSNEIYAVGTFHYPELKPVLENVETGEINLLFGHDNPDSGLDDWTYASDHGPFHQKGVPFVYFGVADHEHYHRHTDDFETIPQEFYKSTVRMIRNAIVAFDEQ